MATYSGFLTVTGPAPATTVGTVDFAAMTQGRAVYVNLRDEGGSPLGVTLPAPGTTPDAPVYTRRADSEPQPVRGAPTTYEEPSALIVSTTAVRLVRSNPARGSLIITNNGSGSLYIRRTSDVTSSGAGMGVLLYPGGAYTDSGDGVYTGELWGIYSSSSTVQNVAVCDRT